MAESRHPVGLAELLAVVVEPVAELPRLAELPMQSVQATSLVPVAAGPELAELEAAGLQVVVEPGPVALAVPTAE